MKNYRQTILRDKPVLYCPMNEAHGTVAEDISDSGTNGTYVATPTLNALPLINHKYDGCPFFDDGASEYTDFGDVLDFEYNIPFSIEFWFSSVQTALSYLVSKIDSTGTIRGYGAVLQADGSLKINIVNDWGGLNALEVATTATGFDDGGVHHCAMTYNGGGADTDISIFVDGVSEPTTTLNSRNSVSATIANAISFNISGRNDGADSFYEGYIGHVAVYDYELTAAQVMEHYQVGIRPSINDYDLTILKQVPDYYWPLNDAHTGTAKAMIGATDGTYTDCGAIAGLMPKDRRSGDTAVVFNSGSGKVSFGDMAYFSGLTKLSISAIFQYGVGGNYILSQRASTNQLCFLFYTHITNKDLNFAYYNLDTATGYKWFNTTRTFNVGDIIHAVAVVDVANGTCKMYVNGVEEAQDAPVTGGTPPTALPNSTAPVEINVVDTTYREGPQQNVAVWDRLLTASEVAEQYQKASVLYRDYYNVVMNDAPVAYWRMNTVSGTTLLDETANNYDGTLVGSPSLNQTGYLVNDDDTCIKFDGTDDEVTFGDIFDWERTQPFSVEMLLHTSDASSPQPLLGKLDNTAPNSGWEVGIRAGELEMQLINTASTNAIHIQTPSSKLYNDDTVHHVICTYDGSGKAAGANIVVDGTYIACDTVTDNLSASILNNISFNIGRRPSNANFLNGYMDEVSIYDYELSPQQALNHYLHAMHPTRLYEDSILATTPTIWLDMNQRSGTTLTDRMGAANGTLTGGDIYQPPIVPNTYGASIYVDGAGSEYASVPDSATTDVGTGDFTWACWVEIASTQTDSLTGIMTKRNTSSGAPWIILLKSGTASPYGLQFKMNDGSGEIATSIVGDLNANTPYFIALVADRSADATLYVNGEVLTTLTISADTATLDNDGVWELMAANVSVSGSSFKKTNGWMSDALLWKRVVTQEELRIIYNAAVNYNAS